MENHREPESCLHIHSGPETIVMATYHPAIREVAEKTVIGLNSLETPLRNFGLALQDCRLVPVSMHQAWDKATHHWIQRYVGTQIQALIFSPTLRSPLTGQSAQLDLSLSPRQRPD